MLEEISVVRERYRLNVAWGHEVEIKTLYCTVGKVLYKIKMGKDGYQLPMK